MKDQSNARVLQKKGLSYKVLEMTNVAPCYWLVKLPQIGNTGKYREYTLL